jgi:diguanylate cyclase (GGDEF)-like protein
MIQMTGNPLPEENDTVLTVGRSFTGAPASLEALREDYPDLTFRVCPSYLSAIAKVVQEKPRVVLADLDPSVRNLGEAVSALREAAGAPTKLILCCVPETEPLARELLRHGADDYVLQPLQRREVDAVIGYARPGQAFPTTAPTPTASMEELALLSSVMGKTAGKPMEIVQGLAQLVRTALGSRGASVIVEGAVASAGEVATKPALTAPLVVNGKTIGQLTVTDRASTPYNTGDAEKLGRYADIASELLASASDNRNWRRLALIDPCSGLPNRRYLHQKLDDILEQAARDHFAVTVLLFDIDNFKNYNDTFGHATGDEVIRHTGELFRRQCREQDVVTRYGGDEFAVVFWDPQGPRAPGSKHPGSALSVLDRVTNSLAREPFAPLGSDGSGKLTISGGLATYPWNATTREELIQKADEALLNAKRAGKNRIYLVGEPITPKD